MTGRNAIIHYLKYASNQNNYDASFLLGKIYYEGKYVTQNIDTAIKYLELVVEKNYPNAKYLLGKIYLEDNARRDIAKSIKLLESSAFFDNPFVEFLLFEFYNDGRFISKDSEKAFFYLNKSIKKEYHKALYHYGLICCNKYSPIYNIKKAKLSFKKAAILGDYDALYQLGLLYYAEIDNKNKIEKLFSSLEFCAEQNNPNACYYLGMIYYNKDNKKNVSRDSKKSIKYFEQALKLNHPNASTLLGVIYYENIEIFHDISKSIYYLSLAPSNILSV